MKRITGFFTALLLAISFSHTGLASDQEMMMKNQSNMMSKKTTPTKTTAVRKSRKYNKHRNLSKYYKGKKTRLKIYY